MEGEFKFSKCQVIVSKDAGMWHLSISRKDRLPNYDEIKYARYAYLPEDIVVAQLFPPKHEFINLHSFCLHLWELKPGELPEVAE
jgi:hypothetical protein